ncbi:hypothetical protein BC829DRAFT_206820 [Chytridium lagenaria]|nr:hypothetical protein BC829DRAFT_206820 [Chytridium lagenaria]
MSVPVQNRIAELQNKINVENRMLSAARAMIPQLNDQNARDQCEASVIEAQRRLDFLEGELRTLQIGAQATAAPPSPGCSNWSTFTTTNESSDTAEIESMEAMALVTLIC